MRKVIFIDENDLLYKSFELVFLNYKSIFMNTNELKLEDINSTDILIINISSTNDKIIENLVKFKDNIIVISKFENDLVPKKYLEIGINHFLSLPLKNRTLMSEIEKIINTKTYDLDEIVLNNYKFMLIGKVFAKLTHRLNQPLTVLSYILSQTSFLYQNDMLSKDDFTADIEKCETAVESISSSFAKLHILLEEKSDLKKLDMNFFCEELMIFLKLIYRELTIVTKVETNRFVNIHRNELILVLIDLLQNVNELLKVNNKTKNEICIKTNVNSGSVDIDIIVSDILEDNILEIINKYFNENSFSIHTINLILKNLYDGFFYIDKLNNDLIIKIRLATSNLI